ncbi:hypothetical protein LZ30DRAFT_740165 [Colletotrichum cereale]|nr:hypothetical protein LZ30DRAFT_740165 [Colletotrichum cereale]
MFMSVPMSVVVSMAVQNGLGKDIWMLSPEQINEIFRLFYIGEHFYAFTVIFAKTNFLFFYLRLFSDERFRRLTWAVIWVCILSAISFLVATTVQCWPVSYTWTKWDGEHQGRCHDINTQTWAHASVNIALDIVVVAMPISQIVKLNWRWKQKLAAGMMFAVALLITLVSIIRLKTIKDFMMTSNPTWDIVPISNWSFIELNGFIFCSCMPSFRSYFRRTFRRRRFGGMDSRFNNIRRMLTVGDAVVQPGGRLNEIVSVDTDDDSGPAYPLQDLSQIDPGVGHLSTGVLAPESDQKPPKASAPEAKDRRRHSQEVDLADLQYLAAEISKSVHVHDEAHGDSQNNQSIKKKRRNST